jgi:hypothetical protein
MNPTIQPGMHPDAESLTAFAEQLLPAAEREEILAHMSACSRCREVVFLAQQAQEDQPMPVTAASTAPGKPRLSWLNWRWAWIPAAACAGIIGVAVLQHSRRVATERQTAANMTSTDALRAAGSPMAETQRPVPNEPNSANPAKSSGIVPERKTLPQTLARDKAKRLDENKPADQKDLALKAAAPPLAVAPGVAGGSMQGMMAGRAKTSSIGGPSATNQFQQQNMANQQITQQQLAGAQFGAANNATNAAPTPGAESETVTVQAQTAPTQLVAAPRPALSDAMPKTEESKAAAPANLARFSKKEKASLPNGLETLSMASDAGRTIALDTKGALFLSEDGGKHWKPVRTQWTGRAVLVRGLTTAEKGNALGAQGALKISPTPRFELVADNLQTWVSADGNTWTLQAMPGK